ncbi:MAG: PolC-type DNA polymerase III [Candidatus Woesearchaeota archaeon]
MKDTPVIVLDIETTGLSPYKHRITEIAAAKVLNGKIVDTFQTLVNPEVPIPPFITRLTGITDDMVRHEPTINAVLPSLKEFLQNHPIVAHNASFDMKFLKHNFFAHRGEHLCNPTICTAKLARRILKELPSKKLGHVCMHYGISNDEAHRAYSDVDATVGILTRMVETLHQCGIQTLEQVDRFQSLPVARASQLLSNTGNL